MADNPVVSRILGAGGSVEPPCDPIRLAHLVAKVRAELGTELPNDYAEFLRHADGAVMDGLTIYGSGERDLEGGRIPDLVSVNLARRAYKPDLLKSLVLGEVDDEFLVFGLDTQRYAMIDRVSLDVFEDAEHMAELVAAFAED